MLGSLTGTYTCDLILVILAVCAGVRWVLGAIIGDDDDDDDDDDEE